MTSDTRAKRTSNRTNREDGDITKARIIEAAGRLFAERGYAETTSKEICELAGTSITGVNYHFGSREGLYMVVLRMMHDYITSPEFLAAMEDSPLPAREKLAMIVDRLVATVTRDTSWQVKLWARESVSPSQLAQQSIHENVIPKMTKFAQLISDMTGLPMESEEAEFCTLNFMAPFLMMLIMGRNPNSPHAELLAYDAKTIGDNLKTFIFAGLGALSTRHAVAKQLKASPT